MGKCFLERFESRRWWHQGTVGVLSKVIPEGYKETTHTSQTITPPFQPWALAWLTHFASPGGLRYLFVASSWVAGFPIMSLSCGTPEAAISNSEVLGQAEDDFLKRPVQVVYSLLPSARTSISVWETVRV
jgi:hypothetical protein